MTSEGRKFNFLDVEDDCVLVTVHGPSQEIQALRRYINEADLENERLRLRLQDQESQLNLAKFIIDRLRAELDASRAPA